MHIIPPKFAKNTKKEDFNSDALGFCYCNYFSFKHDYIVPSFLS